MSRLTLAARIAASRFASTRRRQTRRAPHVWLPIALRRRRQRKQLEKGRLGRAAAPAVTWLSQIHLHFDLRVARTAAFASRTAAAAPLAHVHRHFQPRLSELRLRNEARSTARETLRTETVMKDHSTAVRWGAFAIPPRRLERSLFKGGPRLNPSAGRRAGAVAATDGLRSRPTSPGTRILVDRAHRLPFRTTRKDVRVNTSPTDERTRSVQRFAHIRTQELRIFHRLASAIAHPARNPAREGKTSQRIRIRPQELVWRSAPPPLAEIAAETRRPSRSSAAHDIAPEGAARSGRAALQLKDLDGPLLDRLTDDVIRRVDRRARVERERRGL